MKYLKKSLGQNFLKDENIIRKIVNTVKVENKNIIEIGPGLGAITNEILSKNPKSLILIEKDNELAEKLKLNFLTRKNVKILNCDVLKLDLEKIVKTNSIIFGNLPYNISSQILVKILNFKKWKPSFEHLILMFQKELGNKILGKFGDNNYGRLSILSFYRLELIRKFNISPNCFFPKPKVDSTLIHFKPRKNLNLIKNIKNLEKITNVLFSNKRKMINKQILKLLNKNELKNIPELRLSYRPSEIKPEIFYKITKIYEKKQLLF